MKIVTKLENDITDILAHMKDNNPIVIPTDTNYNLACFPTSEEAIDKIFTYKQRPKDKPLSLFFLDPADWKKYGVCKNEQLMELLVTRFLPGPFNIIVDKKDTKYDYMLNGVDSIALGCISNPTWRKFMEYLGGNPIAITSANISGTVDDMLVTKEIAISQLGNCVKYFIESEQPIKTSKSSTIVLLKENGIKICREGDIDRTTLVNMLCKEGYEVE